MDWFDWQAQYYSLCLVVRLVFVALSDRCRLHSDCSLCWRFGLQLQSPLKLSPVAIRLNFAVSVKLWVQ
jgi:hypothetical protein